MLAVIGYHAGFGWLRGGWIGVEVFFVVSGFLITSLLVEERERGGRVDLGGSGCAGPAGCCRRCCVMLAVVAVVTLAVGSAAAARPASGATCRGRSPTSANWGQIVGDIPYFAADPPMLRHLWSLAIEEQFYLVWPLAFVGSDAHAGCARWRSPGCSPASLPR